MLVLQVAFRVYNFRRCNNTKHATDNREKSRYIKWLTSFPSSMACPVARSVAADLRSSGDNAELILREWLQPRDVGLSKVYWIRVMRRVAIVLQSSNSLEWWAPHIQLIAQDPSVRFWRLVPLHLYSFTSRKWRHIGCRLKVWKRRSCHDSCHVTSTTPSISARFHRKVIHSIRHESAYTARENNTSAMNNLNWASTTCRNQPIRNDAPVRWTGKLPWRGYISRKNIGNARWGNTAGSILKGPIHSSVVQTSRITRFRVGNDVVVIHGIWGQWRVVECSIQSAVDPCAISVELVPYDNTVRIVRRGPCQHYEARRQNCCEWCRLFWGS